jgi:hypothetical protein
MALGDTCFVRPVATVANGFLSADRAFAELPGEFPARSQASRQLDLPACRQSARVLRVTSLSRPRREAAPKLMEAGERPW